MGRVEASRDTRATTGDLGRDVEIEVGRLRLPGHLVIPPGTGGIVIFAHGSGSGRHSPRNNFVASVLNEAGLGTLLLDLLTPDEEADRANVFDIELLADRLVAATAWVRSQPEGADVSIGWFGASTGAGAALWAAGAPGADVAAIVSRGGRPDLAGERLPTVQAPTLLIVGEADTTVLELNQSAQARLRCPNELRIVPSASHLFEEPGTLAMAAEHARDWFLQHLRPATARHEQQIGDQAAGFQLMPHTADVMVSAWGSTLEGCLTEAARGLVASFAEVGDTPPEDRVEFTCQPGPDSELLVELLDEVIYAIDAWDVVPVRVDVRRTDEGGLAGEFGVVERGHVRVVGPAPKAVTRHDLSVEQQDSMWRCRVVVDV
jgi:SHS2 domain-containing protein/dienelactone hydrolase